MKLLFHSVIDSSSVSGDFEGEQPVDLSLLAIGSILSMLVVIYYDICKSKKYIIFIVL